MAPAHMNGDERYDYHYDASCPPAESPPATGPLFRFVATGEHVDFHSYRYMYPAQAFANPCAACGLSVYRTLADAETALKKLPAKRRRPIGNRIAVAEMEQPNGRIQPTLQPGHNTWWPDGDCFETSLLFQLVDEE